MWLVFVMVAMGVKSVKLNDCLTWTSWHSVAQFGFNNKSNINKQNNRNFSIIVSLPIINAWLKSLEWPNLFDLLSFNWNSKQVLVTVHQTLLMSSGPDTPGSQSAVGQCRGLVWEWCQKVLLNRNYSFFFQMTNTDYHYLVVMERYFLTPRCRTYKLAGRQSQLLWCVQCSFRQCAATQQSVVSP